MIKWIKMPFNGLQWKMSWSGGGREKSPAVAV